MNKLLAIWKIIWSDQYAVFTFEEAMPNPEWLTLDSIKELEKQ